MYRFQAACSPADMCLLSYKLAMDRRHLELYGSQSPPIDLELFMTNSFGVTCNFLIWTAAAAAQQYTISTIAGGAPPPTPAPGLNMSLQNLSGVAVDGSGNVYFEASLCVFKL